MAKRPGPVRQATRIARAQYAPVDYALKRQQQRAAKENAALQAATQALVGQLQQGIGPAGQAYDAAIQQQQALAQSGASSLAGANPNANIQSSLAAINAPPEQRAQLASQLQAQFPGQGAVLNIEQGTVPGASLVSQKAAEQNFLAGLPALAALGSQQSLKGLLASQADTRDKLLEERLRIGGQIPSLALNIQQAQEQIRQAALDRQFRADQAALDRAAQAVTTPYEQAQIQLEQQKLTLAKQQAKQQTSLGGLTPYEAAQIGLAQQRIDISKKNKSPQQRYKPPSGSDLQEQADLAYYGKQPVLDANGQVKSPGVKAINYQTALFGMLNQGVKLAVAQRYLNQFYAPGERGRPVRSFQQRQAAKKTRKR